jgi:hypothetical protein
VTTHHERSRALDRGREWGLLNAFPVTVRDTLEEARDRSGPRAGRLAKAFLKLFSEAQDECDLWFNGGWPTQPNASVPHPRERR